MGNIVDVDIERERFGVISGLLKSDEGRGHLRRAGHTPGGYLVAAHCDEQVGDVMDRVAQSLTREVIVVAYERGRVTLMHLEPGHGEDAVDSQTVGRESTLGMLIEAMRHSEGSWNLTFSAWKSAVASRALVTVGA